MRITRKYLLGEMTGPFLVGVGSFTLIILLQQFSRLADLVIAKGCRRPSSGASSSPSSPVLRDHPSASLLLGVLLGLGRLAADSRRRRFPPPRGDARCRLPVLAASVITCAACCSPDGKGSMGVPRDAAHPLTDCLRARRRGASEHVFREIAPDVLVYPDRVSPDGQRMSGVFLSFRPEGTTRFSLFAREGRFMPPPATGRGPGVVRRTIHGEPTGKPLYRVASFGRMTFRIPSKPPPIPGGTTPRA